ncbi:hypothetical protein SUGI_0645390 [Cryptomeria japonica]|nr:hypothetical protein SUGI_0645390 [Cryptomeria japonica]
MASVGARDGPKDSKEDGQVFGDGPDRFKDQNGVDDEGGKDSLFPQPLEACALGPYEEASAIVKKVWKKKEPLSSLEDFSKAAPGMDPKVIPKEKDVDSSPIFRVSLEADASSEGNVGSVVLEVDIPNDSAPRSDSVSPTTEKVGDEVSP